MIIRHNRLFSRRLFLWHGTMIMAPIRSPAHHQRSYVENQGATVENQPEVGPGSPSEGSAKFRIRSGTELPPGDRTPPRRWRHTGPWSHSRGNRSGFGIPARMRTQGRRTAGRPDGSRPSSGASPMTGVRGRTGPSRGRPPAAGLSGRSPPRRERAGWQDPRSGHPTPCRAAGGPVTARPAALRDVAPSACPEQDRPAGTPGRPSSRRAPASTRRCLPAGWRARR
jgi:hypothetical protein